MTTLEEKQKELDALQEAFDEYIVSSRELEEELEADFAKCQKDLTKSESRNTTLSSQLANIQTQMTSLETKLSTLNSQLSSETQRRISAENRTEEAENKLRVSEGTLAAVRSTEVRKLKEENEDLCERLAYLGSEVDDYKNILNAEKEMYREMVKELKDDVAVLKVRLEEDRKTKEETKLSNGYQGSSDTVKDDDKMVNHANDEKTDLPPPPPVDSGATKGDREEYIRTLENGLKLTTEKMSATKTKLLQTQAALDKASANSTSETHGGSTTPTHDATAAAVAPHESTPHSDKITELSSTIKNLQEENAALREEMQRLSNDRKPKRRWFELLMFCPRPKRP
mmetsp:Transcript_38030/g.79656  ORF Transcript_38030/g.79656 Transcript_38030/m.79656 type:complete len:341 (-) Transcript_38030:42-1064(-)